jgi:hypothetical protein
MNKIITISAVILLVGAGAYMLVVKPFGTGQSEDNNLSNTSSEVNDGPEQQPQPPVVNEKETVIGQSVEGKDIVAYHFGNGDKEVLLVGGTHGGYSWNTVLLSYEMMGHFGKLSSDEIPSNIRITIIPMLNPDGFNKATGTTTVHNAMANDLPSDLEKRTSGRFNANNVDLNRNFDCEWQETSMWQSREVSGGTAAFSEPEAQVLRGYITEHRPAAALVWYAAAGGVFASNCRLGVLPETIAMTESYSAASGYRAYKEFDFYDISGDMVNWMAKEGIPAISVLLTNHTDTEFDKNKAGIEALLARLAVNKSDEPNNEASTTTDKAQ